MCPHLAGATCALFPSSRVALVAVVRQLCPPPADLPAARPGEELIYLDPHTTQPALQAAEHCPIPDESFHCQHPPSRMSIAELDPSIAVVRPPLGPAVASCARLCPGAPRHLCPVLLLL